VARRIMEGAAVGGRQHDRTMAGRWPDDGGIKGREVRLGPVVVFQGLAWRIREVRPNGEPREFGVFAGISTR
jgi:hypothetical protein